MSSNHFILFQPLLLLPSVFPSISCCLLFNDSAVLDTFATPWTVAHQAPLSMRFPRQEYWSGFPFPSTGNLPDPGIEPASPILQANSLPLSDQGSWASGSFLMSQFFFASSGQSIGASASASVLPMNIQDWFPLGWTALNSLQSKGLSRILSSARIGKHQSSAFNLLYGSTFTSVCDSWKNHSFDYAGLCWQNDVSSFLSKDQASFNFVAAVTVHSDFGAQENPSLLLRFSI